ncbi:hypothetical protein BDW62DRAFT_206085 [Aspergillus aurantiobrunneus]
MPYGAKAVGYFSSMNLQISFLTIQALLRTSRTDATIPANCFGVVGTAILAAASHYEHAGTPRASTLLLLYLGYSTIADALRARTLWSILDNSTAVAIFTLCCVCKFGVLVTERWRKSKRAAIHQPTPEEQADIISRAFLWWVLPLFRTGRKKTALPLTSEKLPDVERKLVRPVLVAPEENQRRSARGLRGPSIFHDMFCGRGWMLLSPVIPRLAYVGFTFAQPFLVHRATRYMSEPAGPNIYKIGGGLIGAYTIVYVGIAASQSFYRQCTARVIAALRADLVGKVHSHTLKLSSSSASRESASTLMSADVERFVAGTRDMHECWGCLIEVALGIWLLAEQLGVTAAATGGLTVTFLLRTIAILKPAAKRQNKWLKAMENRLAATTQALQTMKGIKTTGIASVIRGDLIGLRKVEVSKLRRFRYILFLAFEHTLTPAVAYQALKIFEIFGNGIAVLINSSIHLVTAVASLLRIQEFLLDDNTRRDSRLILSPAPDDDVRSSTAEDETPLLSSAPTASDDVFLRRLSRRRSRRQAPRVALQLTRASTGWNAATGAIVQDANLAISSPTVLAVVGPVGSGKTTMLQILLGEAQTEGGSVALSSSHIGYCSQTPWLINDTVRNNIVGPSLFDERWYNAVIRATALNKDLRAMRHGDSTVVANEGGEAPIVILDDPFNGLDGGTEAAVLDAVLGREGLLRNGNTLVVWATNTGELLVTTMRGRRTKLDVWRGLSTRKIFQEPLLDTLPEEPSSAQAIHATAGIYRYYVNFSGRRRFGIFLLLCATFVFGITFTQYWVARWAESSVRDPKSPQDRYIGVYFALGAIALIAWTAAAAFFVIGITQRSADRCHKLILDAVLAAPMSFFDSTAAGETINRFSQDMQLIDTELPYGILGTVTQAMVEVGLGGIIIYSSPWSGLAIPAVAIAVYYVQLVYLPTSRQLGVLEIETKAPLFSHFLETLNGLATIRAFGWTADYARQNIETIQASQKPFYLLFSAQNWLNLVLDLITAGLAVVIMCVGVATRSPTNSTLGLALLRASNVGLAAKRLVSYWTKLETSMAVAERVRAFTGQTPLELPSRDDSSVDNTEDKAWHGEGSITFSNVCARYTPTSPLVLQNVSFTIQPGQRFGVCGRTGSGKSTLLGALLRLINLHSGRILVDGADISTMHPNRVRSRFITLPQEPVLVTGKVRHNMQLYAPDCEDSAMIAALQAFGLWEAIHAQGGLDVPLTEGHLSHGQRHLFCFARATLQAENTVILDEPSSQIDRGTEEMIDRAIRERLKGHTVLCIAHKLSTILSLDTVIVMDSGCGRDWESEGDVAGSQLVVFEAHAESARS